MEPELATFSERFRHELVAFGPHLAAAVAVLLGFWIAARIVAAVVRRLGGARALDPDLMTLLGRAVHGSLLVVGVVSALGTLGVDVTALVAGLGLTGFALGFALRDIISNTLAGVLILLFRPFHRGDHVSVAGAEGVVADVDLRYTTLVVDEGTRVLVPNSTLFTNAIRVQRRPP